jgi:Rad3-related DNA helicase
MGIKNSESWFHEWRDPFPAHLSPVYWVPTGKMGRHEGPEAMERSVARTDEMADIWAPNHKGIIHTHSYERAEEVRAKSKWGKWMIVNKDANDIHTAEDKYRNARPPAILVSPSFSTGFDFPDSACDWQVINKLPFPKRNDPVVMARMESDDQYYNHETMQTFVQATKRGTRHERDGCVTIVTDDAVGNFRKYAREYAPKSFKVLDAPGGRVPGVPEWMRK